MAQLICEGSSANPGVAVKSMTGHWSAGGKFSRQKESTCAVTPVGALLLPWDVDKGVVGLRVEETFAARVAHAGEMQLVYVSGANRV